MQLFIAELLQKLDAVIGDVAIVANRWKIVDFTQPYVESGLVVVVPIPQIHSNGWAFLRPFTVEMWCTTGAFFLIIGAVVWILEHRSNQEFRGHPKEQVCNVLWFAFSTMFFSHGDTVSTLGRAVLIIWLFVVLIINSSYTANLSAILTMQHLSPKVQGIGDLIRSNSPIGYQTGSFVRNYLSEELNIAKSRLVPFDSPESYARALSLGPNKGGVAAIVDELPYIQLFLSKHCGFTIVGGEFTKREWGFGFPNKSPLTADMSTAILSLSESGKLQEIHDKWLKIDICDSQSNQVESNKFGLKLFWGVFLVTGIVCSIALLIFFCHMIWQFSRHTDTDFENSSHSSLSLSCSARALKSFAKFMDKREDAETKRRLKRMRSDKKIIAESEMCQTEPVTSVDKFSVDQTISPL